jgi:hypothetical protein
MGGWENSFKGDRVMTPKTRGGPLSRTERAEVAVLRQRVDADVARRRATVPK